MDLARAIGEIEQRVTELRYRVGSVDISPDAMLDEIAQLLQDARALVKPQLHLVSESSSATPTPVDLTAREDDWSELLREPYFRTDAHGIVTAVNTAACDAINVQKHFILGRPLAMFVGASNRKDIRHLINRLTTVDRVDTVEVDLRGHTGDGKHGFFTAAALRTGGKVSGARWVFYASTSPLAASMPALPSVAGEKVGRRTAILALASGILARSLDFEDTLLTFATLSIPLLGDWCIVDVLEENGAVRRPVVTCAPTEPISGRLILASRAPTPGRDRTVISDVLAGAPAQLVRLGAPAFPATLAATSEELELLERLHVTSALVLPLEARGQTLGAVTFLFAHSGRRHGPGDLTLAQELAARVAVMADNARLYREAQRANQAKSDFLAAMSHELRTPLTAVIGYTEILLDEVVGDLAPIQKEQLSRIRASSQHLLVLVEEILAFARLEAGSDHLSLEEVDLSSIVDQAVTLIATQARVRQLSVVTDVPGDIAKITGDPAKIRQILVNLLANGVKFTQRGEVGVRVRLVEQWLSLTVWDTGIGIPPEHLEHIFDPFWQVDQKATRAYGGSGLGLAVVRRLARLMGGDVAVSSDAGQGSTFTVRLPSGGPSIPSSP